MSPERLPNYDKRPTNLVRGVAGLSWSGCESVAARLREATRRSEPTVLAIELYAGVDESTILELVASLEPSRVLCSRQTLLPESAREALLAPFLGGDDPLFGYMCPLEISRFFDAELCQEMRRLAQNGPGLTVVWGEGASLCCEPDLILYADMPRWEIQLRQRAGKTSNLWFDDPEASPSRMYKRAFFADWRILDRHKAGLLARVDYVLDTTTSTPKMVAGEAYRAAMRQLVRRPLRFVPFFDPGPWGGEWMRQVMGLDPEPPNFAWCFDCVPEENSLLLDFDGLVLETPGMNLVLSHPIDLMGREVADLFDGQFPIRFDLLDTMDGGNLSLQVHPTVAYIRERFGMSFTQDESYYLLDAAPGAQVYLGLREDADVEEFWEALERSQRNEPFDAERFAQVWPAKKHDHFLIPAGTLHCSGANCMVLEVSATPFIFTFKLWDWGRVGLDGMPRPINLGHGRNVLDDSRRTSWVREHLVDRAQVLVETASAKVERTGLHETEFIETTRYWVREPTTVYNESTVYVFNLVDGEIGRISSPTGAFEPFEVHYAETFVVPAAAGDFTLESVKGTCVFLRACVDVSRARSLLC